MDVVNAHKNEVQPADEPARKPVPEWVSAACPRCGSELISVARYIAGRGYLIYWECSDIHCLYRRCL